MKILLLLLLSSNIYAANLSEKLFFNKHSGFDVTDEQIAKLENAANDLIDVNYDIVEKSLSTDPTKKWKPTGYVTTLGVTSTGKLGILGFKGTASSEIFWRKKQAALSNKAIVETENSEKGDIEITDLSEEGINNTVEQMVAVVRGSNKVSNPEGVREELRQKLTEFSQLAKGISANQNKPWYLSGIRIDFSVGATGKLNPVYSVGGVLLLRVTWVPVKEKLTQSFAKATEASNSLTKMIEDLTTVLADVNESNLYDAQGLKLDTIRFGLGVTSSFKVVFGSVDPTLVFSVLMTRNFKYIPGQKVNVSSLNNPSLPVADGANVTSMDWNLFKKGIKKAYKLSRSLVKRNAQQDKDRKWEIYLVRNLFAVNPSKGIGLVTLGGTAQIHMIYKK